MAGTSHQRTVCPCLQLLRALGEQHITHFVAVPTLWQALATTMRCVPEAAALLKLRMAVSSGERLPASLLAELQQLLPSKCRIWNLYGSTEVAADCTAFDCTGWQSPLGSPQQQQQQQEQAVPVGSPISGTLIAILDQQADPDASNTEQPVGSDATSHTTAGKLQVVPFGSVGQVAVAGAGLAAGSLGSNEAATQQRFVQLPTSQLEQAEQTGASVVVGDGFAASFWREGQDSTRLCLTGDLGWLDAADCLHLAGRTDLQVKIAGRCTLCSQAMWSILFALSALPLCTALRNCCHWSSFGSGRCQAAVTALVRPFLCVQGCE